MLKANLIGSDIVRENRFKPREQKLNIQMFVLVQT